MILVEKQVEHGQTLSIRIEIASVGEGEYSKDISLIRQALSEWYDCRGRDTRLCFVYFKNTRIARWDDNPSRGDKVMIHLLCKLRTNDISLTDVSVESHLIGRFIADGLGCECGDVKVYLSEYRYDAVDDGLS